MTSGRVGIISGKEASGMIIRAIKVVQIEKCRPPVWPQLWRTPCRIDIISSETRDGESQNVFDRIEAGTRVGHVCCHEAMPLLLRSYHDRRQLQLGTRSMPTQVSSVYAGGCRVPACDLKCRWTNDRKRKSIITHKDIGGPTFKPQIHKFDNILQNHNRCVPVCKYGKG
jgi:hypothetical protein